jgi:hypothetical protein
VSRRGFRIGETSKVCNKLGNLTVGALSTVVRSSFFSDNQPMPLAFAFCFGSHQRVPSAFGKNVNIAAFGQHEGRIDRAHVIHFHGSPLAVLLEPFRKHEILDAHTVNFVIVFLGSQTSNA